MKLRFEALKKYHYSSQRGQSNYLGGEDLYSTIGYNIDNLVKQNPGYENTCAVRLSLALLAMNVKFEGRLKIKAGPYKGKMIEPGAKLLADQLRLALGKPQIFREPDKLKTQIWHQRGIIFFSKIVGYGGGHIDLIEPDNANPVCHSNCYFTCEEVWFWKLD